MNIKFACVTCGATTERTSSGCAACKRAGRWCKGFRLDHGQVRKKQRQLFKEMTK